MTKTSQRRSTYPPWAPRFWHGMLLGDWLRLLAQNRFRVHPLRWGLAFTVTSLTAFNSTMKRVDDAIFGRRVANTKLIAHPIFILGHWRAGTTFLHELMSCDSRLVTPSTYQCFAANHFLVTEPWLPRLFWCLMPRKRPMDNVKMGWHEPQEDEFALCSMGLPSPYLRIAFPNTGHRFLSWLDMEGLPGDELDRWRHEFDRFLRRMTFQTGKRLILKSPTHTGRLRLLNELYPDARFIHIVRSPWSIFPSTVKLWDTLDEAQGLQFRRTELEDFIFLSFRKMYEAFEHDRAALPRHRLVDVRYEDVVLDSVRQIRRIYQQLDLGDFEPVRSKLEELRTRQKGYQTNQFTLTTEQRLKIARHFHDYAARYGYEHELT